VYGVPDAITGEQVEAALILRERQAVSDGEILALCRQQLANFKVPARVRFVESLPKNPTGKILKRVLRQQEGG
jgi:long-chain acyl-CoA synthetase